MNTLVEMGGQRIMVALYQIFYFDIIFPVKREKSHWSNQRFGPNAVAAPSNNGDDEDDNNNEKDDDEDK